MEFVNLSGFIRRTEQKRQEAKAKLEEQKTEEAKAKSRENNKVYIIAGIVGLLGTAIILFKTRKR
jgi:LPXTG-motif cell wall-anchored protein